MQSDLTIRSTTPADSEPAAELIHLSGPDIYRNLLGREERRALQITRTVFRVPAALISFDNTTVAERNGRLAALMLCYDKQIENAQGLRYLREVKRALPPWPFLLSFLYMLLMRFMVRPMKRDSWFCSVIAVAPEIQGGGIGTVMLNEMCAQARNRGLKQLEADVEIGHDRALRFYQKNGWKIIATRRSGILRRFLGFAGYYRIECGL